MVTSWLPGLGDSFFLRYLALVLSILGAFGLLVGLLRCSPLRTYPAIEKSWVALRSWLVMVPLVLLALGLGRASFIVLLGLLSLGMIKEFARATGLYQDWGFTFTVYAVVAGFFWSALTRWHGLFVAMPVYGIVVLLMLPVLRNEYAGMIQRIGLSTIALIYLGWFPAHLAYLANHPHWYAYVPFLIIGTELNDVAAFVSGKVFGRRPLIPSISPNKTVEGALGSLAAVCLFVWSVRGWLPGFTPLLLALTVVILWIGGTVGDLVISVVKRDIGIKDMGVLIPGHGGLLDRCDSLILVAPLFFHMVNHYVKFPGGAP